MEGTHDDRFEQPLHRFVWSNDVAAVRTALRSASQNEALLLEKRDDEGRTALHVAALYGLHDMTRLLLENGADVHARTAVGGLKPIDLCPSSAGATRELLLFACSGGSRSGGSGGASPLRISSPVLPSHQSASGGLRHRGRGSPLTSSDGSPAVERDGQGRGKHAASHSSGSDNESSSPKKETPIPNPENVVDANRIESTEVVNPRTMRKVIIVVLLPFVALVFVNGIVFGLEFLLVTALFYFSVVGYFISEITIRPPWYHHHPNATSLTALGCPDYWLTFTHNPLTDFGVPYEDVWISSTQGYRLSAWYVPAPTMTSNAGKDTCLVFVHGGGRDRRAWLRHLPAFHRAGYAALLFDFREHGLSTGNCNGFRYGMSERFDVVAAAEYCKRVRQHRSVVVIGTSVGGSAVIMAAALDRTNIDGVVAENAITTCAVLQDFIITNLLGGYFSRHWLSVYVFNVFRRTCSFWLNARVGNKPSKHCQALHCVHLVHPRPLLLMHGTNDDVVPMKHSEDLFRAAKEPKELWICEGAVHCGLYNREPEEFERRVMRLIKQVEDTRTANTGASNT